MNLPHFETGIDTMLSNQWSSGWRVAAARGFAPTGRVSAQRYMGERAPSLQLQA